MDYILVEKGPFQVVGIRKVTPWGGGTWGIVKSDGSNERIREYCGKYFDLGLCFGFGADGSNDYMCAVEWDGQAPGMDCFSYPPATWLKFETEGKISDNSLGKLWDYINNEFLPQGEYKKADIPTIEKYVLWDDEKDFCRMEVWIPVAIRS